MPPKTIKHFNFAKSYTELKKISAWFERDDIDLEEGIKKMEDGAILIKEIKNYLNSVDNQIKILKKENI
jgi:exodeoxyribonuclease VII small subunit